MRGKVARQLRKMIDYDSKALRNPDGENLIGTNAYKVGEKEYHKWVIDPNGDVEVAGHTFSEKVEVKDVYELRCDPIRLVYKQLKKQWKSFTMDDIKRVQREEKSSPVSAEMQEE